MNVSNNGSEENDHSDADWGNENCHQSRAKQMWNAQKETKYDFGFKKIINILIICFLELFAEIEAELTSAYIALLTFKQNEKKMLDLDFKIKTLTNEFNDLFDQNKELKKKMCAVLKWYLFLDKVVVYNLATFGTLVFGLFNLVWEFTNVRFDCGL